MYRLFLSLLLSAFACISVFAVPMEAIQAKISNNNNKIFIGGIAKEIQKSKIFF